VIADLPEPSKGFLGIRLVACCRRTVLDSVSICREPCARRASHKTAHRYRRSGDIDAELPNICCRIYFLPEFSGSWGPATSGQQARASSRGICPQRRSSEPQQIIAANAALWMSGYYRLCPGSDAKDTPTASATISSRPGGFSVSTHIAKFVNFFPRGRGGVFPGNFFFPKKKKGGNFFGFLFLAPLFAVHFNYPDQRARPRGGGIAATGASADGGGLFAPTLLRV